MVVSPTLLLMLKYRNQIPIIAAELTRILGKSTLNMLNILHSEKFKSFF